MAGNIVDSFMRGYAFVDDINRKHRADARQEKLQGREDTLWEQNQQGVADQKRMNTERALRYKLENNVPLDDADVEHIKTNYPAFADPDKVMTQLSGARRLSAMAQSGKFDQNAIAEIMNTTYADQINKGTGGTKRLTRFVPGPDGTTVIPELEVTNEKGEKYMAPMTMKRGTAADGDDEVKQIPLKQIYQDVTTRGMLAEAIGAHMISKGDTTIMARMEKQADEDRAFIRMLQGQAAVANKQHENQKDIVGLQNTNATNLQANNQAFLKTQQDDSQAHQTGLANVQHKQAVDLAELQHLQGLEKIYEQAAASKPEAAKMYDYLVEKGVAKDVKDAMQVVQTMKTDPQATILDLAAKAKTAQEKAGYREGDPEFKSDQEIVQMYANLMAELPNILKGASQKTPPPAGGLGDAAGATAPPAKKGNRPSLSEIL